MAISIQKHQLAFDIMKITLKMEQMIEHAPNSKLYNMSNVDYTRFMALNKRKCEMIDELKTLMNNDGDL
ncbi:unnamed protein product [Rotaria socialis]|uniref:Uncharacterized protein n=1 Tax=Rotaria socialis TaxID=392032 RepID=A0A817PBL2_9BILA|nr:unnamed protein product [Rotaria socialis]CAF3610011.1 unnamed protein product [Rotaria socialis]